VRPVRAPTVNPIAIAATIPMTACAQPGQSLGADDSAATGIVTPSSQAPAVTGTQRPECGTVRRRTRHWAYPIARSAAHHAGMSATASSAGGATSAPISAPPPMPTNQANPAAAAVATTQSRRSMFGADRARTRDWATPMATPSKIPASVSPTTRTTSDTLTDANVAPVTAGGTNPTSSPTTNANVHRRRSPSRPRGGASETAVIAIGTTR